MATSGAVVERASGRSSLAAPLAGADAPLTSLPGVRGQRDFGHTRLTTVPDAIGWPTIILTFIGLLLANDAWFYAWHRLLHHPKLFRHVHAVHHKSVDVNPFSSYSFHLAEGLPMLGALQAVGLANNVMSHLGYEFLPRWLLRVPVLRWINTSTFHNLHHSRLRGNYALMFRLWDRLLGTEEEDYERTFLERGAALRAAEGPAPRGVESL